LKENFDISLLRFHLARLPACADLENWTKESTPLLSNQTLLGGLIVGKELLNISAASSTIIMYIGDKAEQLSNISLQMSQNPILSYCPSSSQVKVTQGSKSVEFSQRSGGMLKVKDTKIIGIIVGSMGLTGDLIRTIVTRLQTLIRTSNRKYYTFAMGRLNEAKLSNFPEIDLFCLVGNDDISIVPSK
jgi:diphthamide biosynthesis protein 2